MANRKNIIIISPFWTGIRGFFINGDDNFKGMPAFTTSFLHLLQDERVGTIYTVFFGSRIETTYNYKSKYNKKLKTYGYSYSSKYSALLSFLRVTFKVLWLVLTKKIHVLYGHGSVGGIAGIIGNLLFVNNVRRIYGTFLSRELSNSKLKIFLKHPLEYLAFSLPAKAVVITNDGTKGDVVYNKIGHKKTPLYFWLNGIDKENQKIVPYSEVAIKYNIAFRPQMCYIARIDKWKRQHLLVDILVEAKKRKKVFNTIIAGPVINKPYFSALQEKLAENGLEDSVTLIPGLTKEESLSVIKNSVLSISFYELSNLGNVFLESLSLGTVMLSENINGSLALIDNQVYVDIDPEKTDIAVNEVERLLEEDEAIAFKAKSAQAFSNEFLLTWKERTLNEIALLDL